MAFNEYVQSLATIAFVTICAGSYYRNRLLSCDPRFADDPIFIFVAYDMYVITNLAHSHIQVSFSANKRTK
jgi:hypothetical protein